MHRLAFIVVLTTGLLPASPTSAQTSASFRLEESAFNAGGHPRDAVTLSSASFSITLHSIGEGVTAPVLAGSSLGMEAGLVAGLVPPGEVSNLRFAARNDLVWDPDRSVGHYALYRGALTRPFDPSYGSCVLPNPTTAGATDTTTPTRGRSLFYLVTARNRLGEEGTKGAGSDGVERDNGSPCP